MLFKDNQFELDGLLRRFGKTPQVGEYPFGSGSINILKSPEKHRCPLPLNWSADDATDPLFEEYKNFNATRPTVWYATFDNAVVLPPYNIVLFDFSRIFSNSVRGNRFINHYFVKQDGGKGRLKREYWMDVVAEDAVVIDTSERNNYFHWLIEVLPRYYFAKKLFGTAKQYIFSDIQAQYKKDSLADLTDADSKIIVNNGPHRSLLCKKLFVPSLPGGSILNFNSQINEYASFAVSKLALGAQASPEKRIYVSRSDADFRRVLNEDDLYAQLFQKFGFEKVVLSELSFAEQKQLFYESRIIVSAHGAGLANLIFCRLGTSIIELTPKGHQHMSPFWTLSYYLGKCSHYLVRATLPDANLEMGTQKVNFYADTDVVISLVDKIQSERSDEPRKV